MTPKTTSIRLDKETREWLERNGKPFAKQLREDLEALQRLQRINKNMLDACRYVLDWSMAVHGKQTEYNHIQQVLRMAVTLAED